MMQHSWLNQDLPESLRKWQQPMLQEAYISREDPSTHAQRQVMVAFVQQAIAAVSGSTMQRSELMYRTEDGPKGKAGWRGLAPGRGSAVHSPRAGPPQPPMQLDMENFLMPPHGPFNMLPGHEGLPLPGLGLGLGLQPRPPAGPAPGLAFAAPGRGMGQLPPVRQPSEVPVASFYINQ